MTTIQGVKVLPTTPVSHHVALAIQNAKGHIHILKPDVQPTTEPIVSVPQSAPSAIITPTEQIPVQVPVIVPTPSMDAPTVQVPIIASTTSTPVPSTTSTPSISSTMSQVSKAIILYPDEAIDTPDISASHEIGLIEDQMIEGNIGYIFTISTKNTEPIQYMTINILSKSHIKYNFHAIPFDENNVYNGNCAQFEIRNMDKKDMNFAIQYIAYF
jgi:hypothetical protein